MPKGKTIGDELREEGLIVEPKKEDEVEIVKKNEDPLVDLTMRVDRIEGKLDIITTRLDAFSQNISDANDKIGDLRRMVIDREKTSSELEANFERVKMIVEDIDPERIARKFEKFEGEIEKQKGKIEKNETFLNKFGDRLKKIEDNFSKIKSFENLVNVTEEINKEIKKIKEDKRYTDKLAAKVEGIFSEMKKELSRIKKDRETISKVDELTNNMIKDLDMLKLRFEEQTLRKDDLDSIKSDIEKEAKEVSGEEFVSLKKKVAMLELKTMTKEELLEEKKKTMDLIERFKHDYENNEISAESYNEFKKASEEKLKEINSVLYEKWGIKELTGLLMENVPKKRRRIFKRKKDNTEEILKEVERSLGKTKIDGIKRKEVEELKNIGIFSLEDIKRENIRKIKSILNKKSFRIIISKLLKSGHFEILPEREEKIANDLKESYKNGLISDNAYEKSLEKIVDRVVMSVR